jgi:hypothetical protein
MEEKDKEREKKRTSSSQLPVRTTRASTMRLAVAEEQEAKPQPSAAAKKKQAFHPSRCSVTDGYWAYDRSKKLLYTDQTCPYIDRQDSCQRNGRPDSDYLYWDWHLDDCSLPRSASARVFDSPSCLK